MSNTKTFPFFYQSFFKKMIKRWQLSNQIISLNYSFLIYVKMKRKKRKYTK
ncbi:hypothetical protein PRO82_000322 [Candidatus Protochlamydia amoebophila]|nr:hypothetical protein [Candidatus Protochlamydia amoebophila]